MSEGKVKPFDSFSEVYKIILWAGFFKLLKKPKHRFISICHQIYRPLIFLFLVVYNISHIIYMIQKRHDWDELFEVGMLEIPQIKLLVKILALNLNVSKVDAIYILLHDPIFSANSKTDEEMLLRNQKNMHRCVKIVKIVITVTGLFFWTASFFAKRFQDPTAIVTAYRPFESNSWTTYTISVFMEVSPMLWIGYGHLSLDCLVATYYAQAEVQLRIIKYNLEHLFDTDDASRDVDSDIVNKDRRRRFVHYVQRYEAVAWYTKTVSEVFNTSTAFELFSSSASLCIVTYKISSIPISSVQFFFLVLMLMTLLTQVFAYCYFGHMVHEESNSVITSIYLSDWLSATPELRRLILMSMQRWTKNITPKVSKTIPLALTTFVAVVRFAYSLFAIVSTK